MMTSVWGIGVLLIGTVNVLIGKAFWMDSLSAALFLLLAGGLLAGCLNIGDCDGLCGSSSKSEECNQGSGE